MIFYQKLLWIIRSRLNSSTFWVAYDLAFLFITIEFKDICKNINPKYQHDRRITIFNIIKIKNWCTTWKNPKDFGAFILLSTFNSQIRKVCNQHDRLIIIFYIFPAVYMNVILVLLHTYVGIMNIGTPPTRLEQRSSFIWAWRP